MFGVPLSFPDPPLGDDVVTLRPWSLDDVDAVTKACQDPDVARWTTVPTPYTEADAIAYLRAVIDPGLEHQLNFAVVRRDDGEVVGSLTLTIVKPQVAEVGYWTAAEVRGRGYMPRAVRLLARWAFAELGLPRLQLGTFPGNRSSERVAEKLGFVSEGVLRSYMDQRGERRDVRMWSLLPGELA
jgi:RimJ/RimL family protein N-acetyltransferase